MKIKLRCKEDNRPIYEKMLKDGGFIISDDSNLSFVEDNFVPEYLIGKLNGDSVMVYLKDIIIIESYGRDIVARTKAGTFILRETLEHLEKFLCTAGFIRISQSAIIQKSSIEKISHGLSMRLHLVLKAGIRADVTRSYYFEFKKIIGL